MDWEGSFTIKTAGAYTFQLTTDDGGRVWIDGTSPTWHSEKTIVVDNWGFHSEKTKEGTITLFDGVHKVYGMMF